MTAVSTSNNFTQAFLDIVDKFGGKAALVDPDSLETIRFNEFNSRIDKWCYVLRKAGFKKGIRIGTVAGNSIDYLLFVLVCLRLETVVVPINPASRRGEMKKYVEECGIDRVFGEEELEQLSKGEKVEVNGTEESAEDLALIFFSSGTTGPPKAVCHSHRGLIAHLKQNELMNSSGVFPVVTQDDTVHGVLPYFHFGGLMTVFLMLASGATVILNKKWNDGRYIEILKKYRVTITNIVPPIMTFFAHHPLVNPLDFVNLKRIYLGAAACAPETIRSVREKLGVEVIQLFGMTEAGLALLMTPVGSSREDCVGLPMPGVVCKLTEEHELLCKSPTLMIGYANSSNESFLDCEGFFNTGDLARVAVDGQFRIIGRKKDTFKVRGWQVNPWELEESIRKLEGVEDCAVVGTLHGEDGHRPRAFVVGSADPKVIMAHVEREFISYKHLKEVVKVEGIPRNASGKILKRELE